MASSNQRHLFNGGKSCFFIILTVPQEEDDVLRLVNIRLNIQGSVKSLPPFVVPVAGLELFVYKQEKYNMMVSSTIRRGLIKRAFTF